MDGTWLRDKSDDTNIVFIHGINSNGETCWRHEEGAYWPDLLKQDTKQLSNQVISNAGIFVYTYRTGPLHPDYQLGDVVTDLKERFKHNNLFQTKRLIFVVHSMGGIVTRRLLVQRAKEFEGTDIGLFLIASPSKGSYYASFLSPLTRLVRFSQAQILRVSRQNVWLNDLHTDFLDLRDKDQLRIFGKELLEDTFIRWKTLGIFPQVVQPFSGATYFSESYTILNTDHFSIAKPRDKEADQHRSLMTFIDEFFQKFSEVENSGDTQADLQIDNSDSAININITGSDTKDVSINGLTVNYNAAPTQQEIENDKPNIKWNLTQTRNKHFTGRQDVLDKLVESFQGNSRAAVTARQTLHGLGGIGKTQLAIEFCYRNRDTYDVVWWVDAEEETNILSALAAFAELQGYQAENQLDLAKKAILWFNANKGWLLVFDNAANAKAIEAYIPSSDHGHVLITSRWKNWDGVASDVKIDVWSEEEALAFLKDRLGEGTNEPELKRLAEEMGRLPLAIAHAAAYISTKQVSVSTYLELYSEYRADLHLSEEQLNNYDKTVAAAILLSVKDLEEQNKDIALALLYHCAFLPPEGIDTSFFMGNRDALQGELSEALQNPIKAIEYWHDLELLSLVDKQGETIFIHRVVQAVLLDSLEEDDREKAFQNSLSLLKFAFQFEMSDIRTWESVQKLASYTKSV